jgi:predicted GTPase
MALNPSKRTSSDQSPERADRSAPRRRVVIVGAAGRDFHDFNVVFRDDPGTEVVAFTAAQIPGTAGRRYQASLAGPLYPDGIAIVAEAELSQLCATRQVDEVVFAYSDVAHEHVCTSLPAHSLPAPISRCWGQSEQC